MKKLIRIFIFVLIIVFIVAVRRYSLSLNKIIPSGIERYQEEDLLENVLFFRDIESSELVGKRLEYNYQIDTIEEIFEVLTSKSNTLPLGYRSSLSPSTSLINYQTENDKLILNVSEEFNNSSNIDNVIEELYVNYYLLGYKRLSIEVNGNRLTSNFVTESVISNKVYDEITVTNVKSIFVVKEKDNNLIPEIHVIKEDINLIDYLYEQYKGYISMLEVFEDTITISTYSEDDIYLISLIINSNFSNEYGIIVKSR